MAKKRERGPVPEAREVVKLWPSEWADKQIWYGTRVVRRRQAERGAGSYKPPLGLMVRRALGSLIPVFLIVAFMVFTVWYIKTPHTEEDRRVREQWQNARATAQGPGFGSSGGVVATQTPVPPLLQ